MLGEELELGFAPFLPPELLLPCTSYSYGASISLCLCTSPLSAMFWGSSGREEDCQTLPAALQVRFSLPGLCFYPIFLLPHFLSLLTWLTSPRTPPAGSRPGGQVPAEL